MAAFTEPLLFALWIKEGMWKVRVDRAQPPWGKLHVHIRRGRGAKGEYSWNEDGSRHDKHKFPVSEDMIGKAKEIAAERLKVPKECLKFLIGVPRGTHFRISSDGPARFSSSSVSGEFDFVLLASENWLVLVATLNHVAGEKGKQAVAVKKASRRKAQAAKVKGVDARK